MTVPDIVLTTRGGHRKLAKKVTIGICFLFDNFKYTNAPYNTLPSLARYLKAYSSFAGTMYFFLP